MLCYDEEKRMDIVEIMNHKWLNEISNDEYIDSNVVKTTAIIQSDTSNQDNVACIATIEL